MRPRLFLYGLDFLTTVLAGHGYDVGGSLSRESDGEDDLNALKTTGGRRTVRVECVGRDGRVVIDAKRKWPFVNERGYDYPHTHLVADRTQVQRADRCRLRGTRVRLQADVEGALPR